MIGQRLPPAVMDGADNLIVSRHADGHRKCARFKPEGEGYDQLDESFGTAVNPHLQPPSQ